MTFSETLVTGATVGVLLVVAARGMDGIRTELKRRQTVELLDTLDRALAAYHQATGQWPTDDLPTPARQDAAEPAPPVSLGGRSTLFSEPPASDPRAENGSTDRILAAVIGVPAARTVLETLPEVLRTSASGGAGLATAPAAWGSVRDSWGRSLACLTAANPSAIHRKAVAANQNRPIFVSAGPDGRFGLQDVSAASDNLRSDELRTTDNGPLTTVH